jgi:hypothetical protein
VPALAGANVVASTPGGQRLHVATLLPQGSAAAISIVGPALDMPDQFWKASLDPMSADKSNWSGAYRLRVEAAGHPRSVNFLHALQGSDAGAAPVATSLVRSDLGSAMSGTTIGSSAVMFVDDLATPLASSSFVVPATNTRVLITGVTPGGAYSVTTADEAGGRRITLSAGGSVLANALGVLDVR